MMNLLMKVDMWFANWDWTDDIADVLWRGKCEHAIVALPNDVKDMSAFHEYAQYLRGCGDWTVAIRHYDFVKDNEVQLIQFRGWSLFRWSPIIRTDSFVSSAGMEA